MEEARRKELAAKRIKRAEQRGALKALRKLRNSMIDQCEEFARLMEIADKEENTVEYVSLYDRRETVRDMKAELEYNYQQICRQAAEEVS